MSKGAFISSAVLHGVVLTLIAMEFSFARFNAPPPAAILMVDLTKVKISDKTNLPKKVEVKKEQKKAEAKPIPPKPKDPPKIQPTKVQEKKTEPPKPKPQPPLKDSAKVIEPPKAKKEEKKQVKKEEPKPTPVPPPKPKAEEPKKPQPADRLKSLLTSVEKVRKTASVSTNPDVLPQEQLVTEGIEGGTDGSLSQILTISERDLIASQLTKCWNIDPGKKDIDEAIVEIRVSVSKDGSVRDATIVNKKSDPVFQSVADSARRAVWICDKDPEKSPFKMLAEKYADHYGDWKTILLRFNPKTGGVI